MELSARSTESAKGLARTCITSFDDRLKTRALKYALDAGRHTGVLPMTIPEYHDEQRLASAPDSVGPLAYIFASPAIAGFTHVAQFEEHGDRGVLMGVVSVMWDTSWVFPDTILPRSYQELNLTWGANCVWLARRTTGPRWQGYVNQPSGPNQPCEPAAAPAWLPVRRTESLPLGQADFPAVARFGETTQGRPLLGFKCLDGWCEIGPGAHGARETLATALGGREARIKGWHDEQRLVEMTPQGRYLPTIRAKITPAPGIDGIRLSDFQSWRHMATITLADDPPPSSKYWRWGLRRGNNRLMLRQVGAGWEVLLHPPALASGERPPPTPWLFVGERHIHYDAAVPPTARFRWTFGDDGAWVPCGQGCCKVEGIAS